MTTSIDFACHTYTPDEVGYAVMISGYNTLVRHRPRLVVAARTATDVQGAVAYARRHALSVGVHCTGHGVSVPADGVLVTTRSMNDIAVDPERGTATVGAGVTGHELLAAATAHGLAPLNGSSPDVGVIGYLLGGGIPLLGRSHGFAADQVTALQVVTAAGDHVTATADRHADLFWALLGGRGNYGIVTRATSSLLPIERIHGGGLWFTDDRIDTAIGAYIAWTRSAGPAACTSMLLMRLPDVDAVPAPIRGRRIAHIRFLHTGAPLAAAAEADQLRAIARPTIDTIAEMAYRDVATVHNDPHGPVTFHARSALLGHLDDAAAGQIVGHAGASGDDAYLVELRHLGGRLSRPSGRASIGRADGSYSLYTGSALGTDLTRHAADARQQRLHTALAAATIGPCVSFLSGPDVSTDHLAAAYDAVTWRRLRELKARHDPDNIFRVNLGCYELSGQWIY